MPFAVAGFLFLDGDLASAVLMGATRMRFIVA
jgi:hypothetical protein